MSAVASLAEGHARPSPVGTPAHKSLAVQVGLAMLIAAGLNVAFVLLSPDSHDGLVYLANWLLLAVCLVPPIRWFVGDRRAVPLFETICLAYAAYFGITGLLLPNQFGTHYTNVSAFVAFTDDELTATLLAVTAGLVVMQVAYALFTRFLAPGLPAIDIPLHKSRLQKYLLVSVVGGLLLLQARALGIGPSSDSPVAAVLNVLANQLNVAIALLSYLVFGARKASRFYIALLAIAVIGSTWIGLTSSMLEASLLASVVAAIIALQLRRNSVLLLVAAIGVGYLLFLQPFKLQYRAALYKASDNIDYADRVGLMFDAALAIWDRSVSDTKPLLSDASTSGTLIDVSRTSLDRLDLIHLFEFVRLNTPDAIPYYNGSSYRYFIIGWIPRLVWPDKPSSLEDNNKMVLDYGVLSAESQQTTAAGLGLVPEAYANFGDLGMLILMAIQGVALAAVCSIFTSTRNIAAQAVVLSVLIFLVNGVGGITAVMYGNLFQNLAANTLLLWVAAGYTPAFTPAFTRGVTLMRFSKSS